MARQPTTIRLNDSEKRILQAAAEKSGTPWTRWARNAALDRATRELQRDVPALRRQGRQDRDDS